MTECTAEVYFKNAYYVYIDVEINGLEKIRELNGKQLKKVTNDYMTDRTRQELKQRYQVKHAYFKDYLCFDTLIEIVDSKTGNLLKLNTARPEKIK